MQASHPNINTGARPELPDANPETEQVTSKITNSVFNSGPFYNQPPNKMPTRPPTPCRHPGCPALVYTGGGYCQAHLSDRASSGRLYDATRRKDDPELAWVKQQRSTARWTKLSRLFRSSFPTCCDPFKRHGEFPPLSHHVHHVTSMRQCFRSGDTEKVFEWENLRSICTDCHTTVEGMERREQPTAHLFADSKPPEATIGFA